MVWPILISVAVTPRISAAVRATGSSRNETAPSAPKAIAKRIGIPSPVLSTARGGAERPVSGFRPGGTCHDPARDTNFNRGGPGVKKSRDYFDGLVRWFFGITNFSPDHTSSIAQTLISTRPSGSAVSRTTTSVRSVATPDDFFGHDTQIMPSGAIAAR